MVRHESWRKREARETNVTRSESPHSGAGTGHGKAPPGTQRADSDPCPPADRVAQIYDELRRIARLTLADWPAQRSLQATALVHEAWLRIARQEDGAPSERRQLLAAAATGIRRILVEHYRARIALRRDHKQVPLLEDVPLEDGPRVPLTKLDAALERLAEVRERCARVVELRFFAGLEEHEIAAALGVSQRTVSSDWRFAKAWLKDNLARADA